MSVGDALLTTNRTRVNTLALGVKLPTMYSNREYVESGGLMSYGPNFPTNGGAPPILSTRFCAGRSRAISRSSSRPSSIWSSI